MHSLSAHLRDPDDHGRLAFHADCPICRRERLVGVLPPEPIVSRRTQALLASGVLALSAATPTAVLAAEPDQEQEGSAAPEQVVGGDPADSPDFDPGGDSTDLPFDDRPPPHAQASPSPNGDDTEPLDEEPAKDIDAPIVDAGDETAVPPAEEQVSPLAQPAPPPPEQPPGPSEAPPSAATPEPPAAAPVLPPDETGRTQARKQRKSTGGESRKREVNEPGAVTPTSGAGVQPAQPSPAASTPVVPGAGGRAEPGDRSHIVHTGESLWSISSDLLGDEASAARIAREVHKLWQLNKERIGTGDPDLLMVGTRLRLR